MNPKESARLAEYATVELHKLIRGGEGDSENADGHREQILDLWRFIDQPIRGLLDDLSGDLYLLSGEEIRPPGRQRDSVQAKVAFGKKDWKKTLELTRITLPAIPLDLIAYLRGRAWGELGFHYAAAEFFYFASVLDATNENYIFFGLDEFLRDEKITEAWEWSQRVISRASVGVELRTKIADVAYFVGENIFNSPAANSNEFFALVLKMTADLEMADIKPWVKINGLIKRAYTFWRLGQISSSESTFNSAINLFPENDVLLAARGLFFEELGNRDAANKDFEKAINIGTSLEWPYVFIAKFALDKNDLSGCLRVVRKGLSKTKATQTTAKLKELMALAYAKSGYGQNSVLSALLEADALMPGDKIIVANLAKVRANELNAINYSVVLSAKQAATSLTRIAYSR